MKKLDCRLAVLEELCYAGEPLSLGDLVRRLRPTWSQSSIASQLKTMVANVDITESTRVDYYASQRHRVVTYWIY